MAVSPKPSRSTSTTVERVRRRFVEQGLEAALVRKKRRPPQPRAKLDGRAEARLIALACSRRPEGRARWTLRLLADKLVELEIVESISDETVRRGSKKNEFKPHLKEQWCIPPGHDAEFVAAMEDVLDVYHRPYDEKRPLICLDEASKQLIGETMQPIPMEPGQPERYDHEYVRNGVMNLFMITKPLLGWRAVRVTDRRTAVDFAEVVRWLVEEVCEEAEKVVLVMDNLNTHKFASLYEAFEPEQARRIADQAGDPPHAQAWQLAEHGGDRVDRSWPGSAWTSGSRRGRTWNVMCRRGRRPATRAAR